MEIEEREVIIFPERLQKYKNRKKFFKNRKSKEISREKIVRSGDCEKILKHYRKATLKQNHKGLPYFEEEIYDEDKCRKYKSICKTSRWFAKIEEVTKRRTLESPLLASLNLDPSEENFERLQGLFSNKDKTVYKY